MMENGTHTFPVQRNTTRRHRRGALRAAATLGPLCSSATKPCALGYAQAPHCCPPGGPQPGPRFYIEAMCCANAATCGSEYFCMTFAWEVNQCNSPSAWCPCQTAGYCRGFVFVPRQILPYGTGCRVQQSDTFESGVCISGVCVYASIVSIANPTGR